MEKIEVISIDGGEIPSGEIQDELQDHDVFTHYSDHIFHLTQESMPHLHAWLVEKKVIKPNEALSWNDRIYCCTWGT
jgi:hypothetical protein